MYSLSVVVFIFVATYSSYNNFTAFILQTVYCTVSVYQKFVCQSCGEQNLMKGHNLVMHGCKGLFFMSFSDTLELFHVKEK